MSRTSPLKKFYEKVGGSFTNRYGVEIVSNVHGKETEYNFVRNTVGITDFSYMQKFRVPEETGLEYLDTLLAGNAYKIRYGRVLHTFTAEDTGLIASDCYVANNDEEIIVLCESVRDDTEIRELFTKDINSGITDITEKFVCIGIDGYYAWKVVKKLFGADVLGLPYLSLELYNFENEKVYLFRVGKTSEFGYILMAPLSIAEKLFEEINSLAVEFKGGLCSNEIHNDLRLEGRFFNVFAEGARVQEPLCLGLQWMIDFDKENFIGHDAIWDQRRKGCKEKIVGVRTKSSDIQIGQSIYDGEAKIGSIKAVCFSYVLNSYIGLALLDKEYAYSGLSFHLNSPIGEEIKTISMPPIMPKSLSIKLDDM